MLKHPPALDTLRGYMSNTLIYYVYAYLRSKDSATAKAGTPYYIGKGKGNRHLQKHACHIPSDPSLIVFLETNLTELGAFAIERRMIAWFGRKVVKTGILLNLSEGGEGPSGVPQSLETRAKRAKALSGRTRPAEVSKKISVGHKGKPKNYDVWNKGKIMPEGYQSAETKAKRSESLTGRTVSVETGNKISAAKLGVPFTDEHKKKLSAAKKGKSLPQPQITCPHCNLTGGSSCMKRYHFDNCKQK